jgi:hypothetical protein
MKKKRASPEFNSPSWLVEGPLVLAILASMIWGVWSVLPLVPAVLMASEVDNYRPARFVVDEVVYRSSRRGADRYYAKGRIDGQPEAFELSEVAPILETREALEKHFGQQPVTFDVMYNPHRMRAQRNDGSTRVLPAQEGFAEKYRAAAWTAVFSTLGSILMAGFALITLRWMSKRSDKK